MARRISLPAVAIQQRREPVEPPADIVALRESSIVTLAGHGLLDADQVAAAFRFRNTWREWARLRSRTTQFEKVDYGTAFLSSALAGIEREDDARKQLQRCRDLLGAHGFQLLIRVCGEGYNLREMFSKRRERDTATDVLKLHLSALARMWSS